MKQDLLFFIFAFVYFAARAADGGGLQVLADVLMGTAIVMIIVKQVVIRRARRW